MATPRYWLIKSEPSVYPYAQLEADGHTDWTGVRSFEARNNLRAMKVGDLCLYYHSNADPSGVAGVARVSQEAYADPAQFDRKSDYYDAGAKRDDPRWLMVEVEHVETLPRVVSLEELKKEPSLATMLVVQKGQRLSVQPVEKAHFAKVLSMGGAKTRL